MDILSSRLQAQNTSVETILDFLPYPFLLAETIRGTVVNSFLNKRFIEEIGYQLAEIPSIQHWFELAYPEPEYRLLVQTTWMDMISEAQSVGKDHVTARVRIYTKTNGHKWFEVKSSLFGDGLHFVSFVNIDDVVIKEEQLTQANENKNKMLSILSHDLRSSVINLYSLAGMAGGHDFTPNEFTSLARLVKEKSSRTLELLDTTVQWTRNNFDSINLKLESIDLESVIQEILGMDDTYLTKQIDVRLNLDDRCRPVTDRGIFTIIMRNLISNAIKFTPPGGFVEVRSGLTHGELHFCVTDSGTGMTPELMLALANDDYTPSLGTLNEKGSGVGLTLCRDLLKKINGRLRMESLPGRGTEMRVVFEGQPGA